MNLKKILLIIIFINIVTTTNAQLSGAVEIGYSPSMNIFYENGSAEFISGIFYIELLPELLLFDFIRVYGNAHVDMYMYDIFHKFSLSFLPVHLASVIGVDVTIGSFIFGYEHLCRHPVTPLDYDYLPGQNEDYAYDKFFIRLEVKKK